MNDLKSRFESNIEEIPFVTKLQIIKGLLLKIPQNDIANELGLSQRTISLVYNEI